LYNFSNAARTVTAAAVITTMSQIFKRFRLL
jgi:hypothetical protein